MRRRPFVEHHVVANGVGHAAGLSVDKIEGVAADTAHAQLQEGLVLLNQFELWGC